ncbi:Alpha/Beta hydrolase fold [Sesbania bispinosa]|nr:Alpha/Beta hydrolase fold [Sesbania bispinosa]
MCLKISHFWQRYGSKCLVGEWGEKNCTATEVNCHHRPEEDQGLESEAQYLSFLIIELIHPGRALLELIPHGVFIDAITWLFNSPDESLAFILADNGFDAYWDWSWDELASYNLPAFVQYVYNYTGQRMHYVGHSLGTLMALAAFSQGQLQTMLRSAALLSPIAHLNQITSQPTKVAADIFIASERHKPYYSAEN